MLGTSNADQYVSVKSVGCNSELSAGNQIALIVLW